MPVNIAWPKYQGRVDDDHIQALGDSFLYFLLGQVFGITVRVVIGAVIPGVVFVDQLRFLVLTIRIRNAQRGNRAGVDHPLDLGFARGLQHVARSFHGHRILPAGLLVPAHPGSGMEHNLHPIHGRLERFWLGQVALRMFDFQAFQQAQRAGGTVKGPHRMVLLQ